MLFVIALIATVVAFFVYKNAKKRTNRQEANFALIGIVVAAVITISQFWTIIPAGHTGVIDFLGNVSDETLKPEQTYLQPKADTTDVASVIEGVIKAENGAIKQYNKLIKLSDGVDYVTQDLCISLLAMEESHRVEFSGFLKEYKK